MMTPIYVALGLSLEITGFLWIWLGLAMDLSAGILVGCVMLVASFRLIVREETDRW
jgi:hypothetical protein